VARTLAAIDVNGLAECRRLWFLSFVCRTEHFARNYKGVSHAKWPKAKHECAATQTGSVICWTLEAMGRRAPPAPSP
jgi:hypothetical protein